MKNRYKYSIIYTAGGLYYALIEILWRGYSHWTMIFTGGFCVLCLYLINERLSSTPFFLRCALGSAVITVAELAVGLIVNVCLKWDVWDYSDKSFNLFGQICLNSSLLWFGLCIPAFFACSIIKKLFDLKEEKANENIV